MMNADRRLAALRRRLQDEEVDAALVSMPLNMRYITGFDWVFDEQTNAACIVTRDVARLYTDFRYKEAAEAEAEGSPWSVYIQKKSLYVEMCGQLQAEGVESLAIEDSVPYGRFKFIAEQFGGRVKPMSQWVEDLRQVKERRELERIQRAAQLGDAAFDYVLGVMSPGKTEREVAVELEFFLRRNGSGTMPFPPIVASGPNSARPHAAVSERVMESGDLVKLDYGARLDGYCSDMTRTVVLGKASERQREIHAAVLEANLAAAAAVRPGVPGDELDSVARGILEKRGMAEFFGHGLGHGVGLSVHELPVVAPGRRELVREGSVVTIEPGVYVEGLGGVRIEDLVAVGEEGCTVLTSSPRDLIEV